MTRRRTLALSVVALAVAGCGSSARHPAATIDVKALQQKKIALLRRVRS
jgi:hypothetical protein